MLFFLSSSQPNPSAQAPSSIYCAAHPSACSSGPNTRTTYEPFACLWSPSQPFSRIWCTTNPIASRATHERLQQLPGSLQRTPTDPLPAQPHSARCTQVSVSLYHQCCICLLCCFFIFSHISNLSCLLDPAFSPHSYVSVPTSVLAVGLFWFLHFVSVSHSLFCIFSPHCSRRPPGAPSHRPTIIRPAEPSLLD